MKHSTLSGLVLGFLLLNGSNVVGASEADELRARAKAMQKEAAVIAERGNIEQAGRLKVESAKLLEAAEQLDLKSKGRGEKEQAAIDKEVLNLKLRLKDLLAREKKLRGSNAPENELAEVRQQIAGIERELVAIHEPQTGRHGLPPEFAVQAEKLEVASRRIHHLRVAAENLKMADAHDLAHELMEKAAAMEREAQEGKKRLVAEMQRAKNGETGDVVRELKQEIERLRAEVKELKSKSAGSEE